LTFNPIIVSELIDSGFHRKLNRNFSEPTRGGRRRNFLLVVRILALLFRVQKLINFSGKILPSERNKKKPENIISNMLRVAGVTGRTKNGFRCCPKLR
jgi:hypothetical protein